MKKKKKIGAVIGEIIMLTFCVLMLVPFYYLVVNTFKSPQEMSSSPLALPTHFTLDNYKKAFASMDFARSFTNSLIITVISVTLIVLLGAMAAYPIARRKHKMYKGILLYFLLGYMVPAQTIMIPLYLLLQKIHLLNNIVGLILVYASWCNFALFLYQGFFKNLPEDVEEAAMIDGCTPWQSFWKIVFPMLKPITTTIVIFEVMWVWNDFLYPYLFLSSNKAFTLVMQVYKGVGQFSNDWAMMLSTMVLVLVPVVIFYLIMQKNIVAGITSGAVKG
ncbi:MAG: carbohydrate ABC transporter permease [Agathobacter rectalis]|nr:carbohydrate ABC transporter permease [Agathobacter rectalis]